MDVVTLQEEVELLLEGLRQQAGFRTVWRGPDGGLLHAEPEDELEAEGFTYVATLMRPDRDALAAALMSAGALRPVALSWARSPVPAELVPAHA